MCGEEWCAVHTLRGLPCPECRRLDMVRVVETFPLEDGLMVKRPRRYRCRSCGARFFDDEAMSAIAAARAAAARSRTRTG